MNGIILLNKPAGLSSNSAVNLVKKFIGAKKAGHLGTLDVLGEGVLPVTLGKATRLFDFFLTKTKTYRAVFIFGFETETLDSEGKILKHNNSGIPREKIEQILNKYVGEMYQRPPLYSALKVNGKNAYELARSGKEVELKERKIEIYEIKLLDNISDKTKKQLKDRFFKFHNENEISNLDNLFENNVYEFEITCSAGTYIRSLCRDIAEEMSTYGTMLSIIRTKCGNFSLDECFTIEQIKNGQYNLLSTFDVIDLPVVEISKEDGKKILDGKIVSIFPIQQTKFKLVCDKCFLGIANNFCEGKIKIDTFLKEE